MGGTYIRKRRNTYTTLVGKTERKRTLGRNVVSKCEMDSAGWM
jgi:hypothetical protein